MYKYSNSIYNTCLLSACGNSKFWWHDFSSDMDRHLVGDLDRRKWTKYNSRKSLL